MGSNIKMPVDERDWIEWNSLKIMISKSILFGWTVTISVRDTVDRYRFKSEQDAINFTMLKKLEQ